jgi:hypothetical protein
MQITQAIPIKNQYFFIIVIHPGVDNFAGVHQHHWQMGKKFHLLYFLIDKMASLISFILPMAACDPKISSRRCMSPQHVRLASKNRVNMLLTYTYNNLTN